MSYKIKQHDTRPVYAVQLLDQVGTPSQGPLNLTGATGVKIKMRTQGGSGAPKVNASMTVTDAANGKVEYTWLTADLDTVGIYDVEFEVTWSSGGIETIPNDSYLTIEVVDDLDSP